MSAKGITFSGESGAESEEVPAFHGDLRGQDRRFGIVVSRFNSALTDALLSGAVLALHEHGTDAESVSVARVPGAFEIPLIMERWAASGRFSALIALGCVIEGETPHAELIGLQVTRALSEISIRHGVPVIDGVVTTRSEAQAQARCRPGREGRGWYAGCAALEMADLIAVMERAGQ